MFSAYRYIYWSATFSLLGAGLYATARGMETGTAPHTFVCLPFGLMMFVAWFVCKFIRRLLRLSNAALRRAETHLGVE
jgi:hypothetical protein